MVARAAIPQNQAEYLKIGDPATITQSEISREVPGKVIVVSPAVDPSSTTVQVWVQAAQLGLRVKEVGVPRLYLDPTRAFGGVLNDANERLAYYRRVISDALAEPVTAFDWACEFLPMSRSRP